MWHCANVCDVTTVQLSNGTVHKFYKNFAFHENVSSLYFYTYRYVRAKMIVHAFMIELDQLHYSYPRKLNKLWNSMYKVNGELFSCDITDYGRVPSREGDIQHFAQLVLLNGLSKFASNFTVGFLKFLSTHPIHIVVWGNFPFNINFPTFIE